MVDIFRKNRVSFSPFEAKKRKFKILSVRSKQNGARSVMIESRILGAFKLASEALDVNVRVFFMCKEKIETLTNMEIFTYCTSRLNYVPRYWDKIFLISKFVFFISHHDHQ